MIEPDFLPITKPEYDKIKSYISRLDLLSILLSYSDARDALGAAPLPNQNSLNNQSRGYTTEDYAEAAVLCIRDNEQEVVEKQFMETKLVAAHDIDMAPERITQNRYFVALPTLG